MTFELVSTYRRAPSRLSSMWWSVSVDRNSVPCQLLSPALFRVHGVFLARYYSASPTFGSRLINRNISDTPFGPVSRMIK